MEAAPVVIVRESLTKAQLAAVFAERQAKVGYHRDGLHSTNRVPGCPYCYPEGPNGDYMPPPKQRPGLS